MATATPTETAVDFLNAEKVEGGFKYFDDASGKHWVSDEHDIEELGEQLTSYREAEAEGMIDHVNDPVVISEGIIYSQWCSETDSIAA